MEKKQVVGDEVILVVPCLGSSVVEIDGRELLKSVSNSSREMIPELTFLTP